MNMSFVVPGKKKRVLVVDDHPLIRAGMIRLIGRQEDMTCCGEAEDPRSLFAALADLNPDLILLDLQLGDADGLELIKSLRAQRPNLLIVVLSQCDEKLYAERVLRAGAHGYIMKQRPVSELLAGIRAVFEGELCLSSEMSMRLLRKAIQSDPAAEAPNGRPGAALLTERELRVFRLLGQGIGTREIAGQLELSIKTVEAHRENIKHKLGLVNAAALMQAAAAWLQNNASLTAS